MDNLPLDLLRPIVENLADDSRSLLAVSLASRELRMEGQRILFRRVTPPTNKDHHTKFLTAVTSSSLLALLVEEYHQFDLLDRRPEEPFLGLTCRGLQAMVNLKILRLRTSNHPQSFRGCTFQLEALEWNDYPDVEHILDFLRTQLQLRTLRLYWKRPDLDTSGICPRLQLLHGDRSTMNAFLPGRHVTSIKWTPSNGELLNDSVDHLSREFNHIRFFSVGGWWGHHRLNILIPHLGAVEVFELGGLRSLSVPELQLICEIPRLRILVLSNRPCDHEGQVFNSQQWCEESFPTLFAHRSTLQHIYVGIHYQLPLYRGWSREPSPHGNEIFEVVEVKEALLPEWNDRRSGDL